MVLFHTVISIVSGLLTVLVTYTIYKNKSVPLWGWMASFFPDIPMLWFAPLGVTNLENLMLVTHTVGVLIFPIFLVIIDVVLINLALLKHFTWLPHPASLKNVEKVNYIVERLKRYNAIPKPVRIERVYVAGVLAGIIHLAINIIIIGSL
ncbi:MAG: hypothetical protein ABIF08_02600 [Nanoarchaeota archaeon]